MTSEILLFEGSDGSGKSTLVSSFVSLLKEQNLSSIVIDMNYNTIVKDITFAIKDKVTQIAPVTEILLRLSREYEKIRGVRESSESFDYVIFDRSILSAVSWINYYNENFDDYKRVVEKIITFLGDSKLIYCNASFDTSWKRVTSRGNLSKKESQGEEVNRRMYETLRKTFLNFNYESIKKNEIDTNGTKEACFENLIGTLR